MTDAELRIKAVELVQDYMFRAAEQDPTFFFDAVAARKMTDDIVLYAKTGTWDECTKVHSK